ncbi:Unknown protein, partial [Striga hermonthica]
RQTTAPSVWFPSVSGTRAVRRAYGGRDAYYPTRSQISVLTQGEASHVKDTSGEANGHASTKTSMRLGRQPGRLDQETRPPPQIEEQTLTMTRSEMQRMIAEAVATQIKQTRVEQPRKEGETLRDYVARYTRACVNVPSANEEIKSGGLTRGLHPGLCRNSLAKRPGRMFDEVLGRCAKYMNVEEAEADFLQATKAKAESRDEKKDKKPGRSRGWRTTQYTPLPASNARILEVMEKEIRENVVMWPRTRKDGLKKPKSDLYCRFHKDYGHNTDECRHLKNEIERLIKAGHLKEFVYKDRDRTSRRRERSKSPRKRARTPDKEELLQKRGIIHMIFEGPTDGDSNRARKAYARGHHGKIEVQQVEENGPVMNFGPADMGEVERPHKDDLMITTQISSYEVQRIFVDTGSSVNVIFYHCLKWMELDIELAPLHTSLFG